MIFKIIKLYQKLVSPFLNKRCRFYPSCSQYFVLALEKYGTLKGTWKGIRRIVKCHPWHQGGIDYP